MPDDLLSSLSPEELMQLLELANQEPQGALLNDRMQDARAMRFAKPQPHSTAIGAGLGALTQMIGGYQGGREMDRIKAEQDALMQKGPQGRALFAQRFLGGQGVMVPNQNPMPGLMTPQMMPEAQPSSGTGGLMALLRRIQGGG